MSIILEELKQRYGPRPRRSRDIRKMDKPYTCRDVVFECSNGWTIEKVSKEDGPIEGYFMGHCLGTKDDIGCWSAWDFYSLREPDGTPHVTLGLCQDSDELNAWGRCNKWPKPEYVTLISEWKVPVPEHWAKAGVDDDDAYHNTGMLDDRDYRDIELGRAWRDADWRERREHG
jgi:hypothetical protein